MAKYDDCCTDYLSQLGNDIEDNISLTEILLDDLVRGNIVKLNYSKRSSAVEFYSSIVRQTKGRDIGNLTRRVRDYVTSGKIIECLEGMRYSNVADTPKRPIRVRDIKISQNQTLMPLVSI
tara:strand:+ start:23270 stop:23632 length:363 start_codon:yes stop_codon:yes gene_type:complete